MMDSNIVSQTTQIKGPKPRECGCKGIRSCRLCELSDDDRFENSFSTNKNNTRKTYQYCRHCKRAWQAGSNSQQGVSHKISNDTKEESFSGAEMETVTKNATNTEAHNSVFLTQNPHIENKSVTELCSHNSSLSVIDFHGITIIEDFISEEEEQYLDKIIGETAFTKSQSGRRKQDFGPKVNFKRQKVKVASFSGLPAYSSFLYERIKTLPSLNNFKPVELCNLEYSNERGAHIDPHFDDSWLWGERLVTLNLMSDSTLTFTIDSEPQTEVRVPLLRRSLIIVAADARYKWKHSIKEADILDKRIAMTFRELSEEFSPGGQREKEGDDLLKLALTFQGCAIVH
ncbi:alpha-ketoglutarate-dependent dioxygenase alkB homolog 4-like isoform X2 [Physella acuta]|nr:alpha-ketoglutarate-dependent dioxygenase alkB homolog 4-like isoform X2 [Physella acuta]XP_059175965.1 alpha-ketoglutarate-dependent dioxygenase alkB homolog 4-like isoform X2 [Physella acuta]